MVLKPALREGTSDEEMRELLGGIEDRFTDEEFWAMASFSYSCGIAATYDYEKPVPSVEEIILDKQVLALAEYLNPNIPQGIAIIASGAIDIENL